MQRGGTLWEGREERGGLNNDSGEGEALGRKKRLPEKPLSVKQAFFSCRREREMEAASFLLFFSYTPRRRSGRVYRILAQNFEKMVCISLNLMNKTDDVRKIMKSFALIAGLEFYFFVPPSLFSSGGERRGE